MRKIFVLLLIATPLAGCAQDSGGNAAIRTVGGAAAGALLADLTGGSKTKGALIGALVGGVSCGVPGLPSCG